MNYAAIDVETTGFSPYSDRIVEVGAVAFDAEGRTLSEFSRLINPGRPVRRSAESVHGISDAMLKPHPTSFVILTMFLGWLEHHEVGRLVAHNAAFDARFLEAELSRIDLELPALPWSCTMDLSRLVMPWAASHSLGALCQYLCIDDELPEHRALGDARRTKSLWDSLAEM